MPNQSDKVAKLFEELLKRRGKLTPPTDRLGMERPALSGDFDNQPMAGWEKAAALLGAAVSPGSTIASMVLAPPQEETLFDRAITGPDGKQTILPKTTASIIPTPRNRDKFVESVRENTKKIPGSQSNILGLAYLQARYPQMFKRFADKGGKINIFDKKVLENNVSPSGGAHGEFSPSTNEINLADLPSDRLAVNTLMHELTHATRANRFTKDPKTWNEYYATRKTKYKDNPEEIAARQAARTAELGYAEYIKDVIPEEAESIRKGVRKEILDEARDKIIWRDKNSKNFRLLPYTTSENSYKDISLKNAQRMGYVGTKSWRDLLSDIFNK